MNLRYKELAEQAWDSLIDEMGDVYREDGLNWDFLHDYDKRYAELMVRECANFLEHEYGKSVITGNDAADFIRKHVGVEE